MEMRSWLRCCIDKRPSADHILVVATYSVVLLPVSLRGSFISITWTLTYVAYKLDLPAFLWLTVVYCTFFTYSQWCIGGYTAYTNLRGFLTAYTHLSDHKEAGYLRALCRAPLRIPTSIFSNTPLTLKVALKSTFYICRMQFIHFLKS